VERTRGLEPAHAGPTRGSVSERVEGVDRSAVHGLAGDVDGGDLEAVQLGDLAGEQVVAPEGGDHAGRALGGGLRHEPAALGGQPDGLRGGQHPGEGERAELTDAVPAHGRGRGRQGTGGQQRGGGEQGLGDGGVADLVGAGDGAEVDEVEPGRLGPLLQVGLRLRQGEPRHEHAGGLGPLTGDEDGVHRVHTGRPRPS
jgi:hypothetical protein